MIGRYALGRARLFACRKSLAASFGFGHSLRHSIMLTMSIFTTGLASASICIFTLSICGGAIPGCEVDSAGIQHRHRTRVRDPGHPRPNPPDRVRARPVSSSRRAGRKRCHCKLASSTGTAIERVCRIQITADQKPTDDRAEPPAAEAHSCN